MLRDIPSLLAGVDRASKRIENIVRLLRDYVRSGDSVPTFSPIQINDAIQSASELSLPQIKRATNHFHLALDPTIPLIYGDPQRLEQLFINLFSNAADSLTSPHQQIQIRSWFDANGNRVFVEVEDEGSGIPPEVLARIGDPFFTTKHERGGMGLGVSICMKIIEEHGATIHYSSVCNQGTTVRLAFSPGKQNQKTSTR